MHIFIALIHCAYSALNSTHIPFSSECVCLQESNGSVPHFFLLNMCLVSYNLRAFLWIEIEATIRVTNSQRSREWERANKQTNKTSLWESKICLEFLLRQANLSITVWHSKMNISFLKKKKSCMCVFVDLALFLSYARDDKTENYAIGEL